MVLNANASVSCAFSLQRGGGKAAKRYRSVERGSKHETKRHAKGWDGSRSANTGVGGLDHAFFYCNSGTYVQTRS